MDLLAENRAVLAQIVSSGGDLTASRNVDLEHVFPDEQTAARFVQLAHRAGYEAEVWHTEDGEWNATARARLVPTAQGITDIEIALDRIAKTVGGKADGWGFWRPE